MIISPDAVHLFLSTREQGREPVSRLKSIEQSFLLIYFKVCCFIVMFGSIGTGNVTKPNGAQSTRGAPTAINQM